MSSLTTTVNTEGFTINFARCSYKSIARQTVKDEALKSILDNFWSFGMSNRRLSEKQK